MYTEVEFGGPYFNGSRAITVIDLNIDKVVQLFTHKKHLTSIKI